jgi:hypothetical protein
MAPILTKAGMILCYSGSLVAFLFGLLANQEAIPPGAGLQIAAAGIVTALTGLFASVGIPAWKLWLEYRSKVSDELRARLDALAANQDAFLARYDAAVQAQATAQDPRARVLHPASARPAPPPPPAAQAPPTEL